MQIHELNNKSADYPSVLREIPSPPKKLYVLGNLPKDMPIVAIIGSRRPTKYGEEITYKLASELAAAGIGIVSGLALGIDAIAHKAALDAGGYTIAVMAHGLDSIYPATNRSLAKRILAQSGGIVSEYQTGTPSLKQHFVARNRIISGLASAVVVTEADASSGSLITAKFALDQNRLVMAVPGNITSLRSAGPNNLIKNGALPITSASDILAALQLDTRRVTKTIIIPKSAEEAQILKLLDTGLTGSQELIAQSQMTAAQFANVITLMEITGKVRNLGAGTWIKG